MKFKNLSREDFTILYEEFPMKVLKKLLGVYGKPLTTNWVIARRDSYNLPKKPWGRPPQISVYRGEERPKYTPEQKALLYKTLYNEYIQIYLDKNMKKENDYDTLLQQAIVYAKEQMTIYHKDFC